MEMRKQVKRCLQRLCRVGCEVCGRGAGITHKIRRISVPVAIDEIKQPKEKKKDAVRDTGKKAGT